MSDKQPLSTLGLGVFAQPDMEPPLNAIYAQLRDIWKAQEPGRSFTMLADLFGVPTQNVSQWATGSDGRKPPWHVVMYLCAVTGYRVVGTAKEWRVERDAPAEAAPTKRAKAPA